MGSLNFTIDIKVKPNSLNNLLQRYNNNFLYQHTFAFGVLEENQNEFSEVGISAFIDNFLPANYIIYDFLSGLNSEIYIKTGGVEKPFNFKCRSQYMNFMYNVWESRIDYAYKQFGVLLVDNKHYYKIRNKLYKKYYMKLGD